MMRRTIGRLDEELAIALLAIQFLTRIPVRSEHIFTPDRLAATPRYYALVGVLVGAAGAAVLWLGAQVVPMLVAALVSTAATILLTGAFHEDGLADTFDGVGGGLTREHALEIMKDSRVGTYGALALVVGLQLKVAILSALPLAIAVGAVIAAHALSRASAVVVIATSTYVRFEGKSKPVATGITAGGIAVLAVTSAAVMAGLLMAGWSGRCLAGAVAGLCLAHIAMRLFFERKLGGYTGDALGATQQASEAGFLLGALACL